MIDGYVNPGQEPFILPQELVNKALNSKELKKLARKQNKEYYKLTGLKKGTASCRYCHRKACRDKIACKVKYQERQQKKYTLAWYFRSE